MRSGVKLKFPSTLWTLIKRAARAEEPQRRQAMGELLNMYLRPLRSYLIVTRRLRREDADDLIQGFYADKVLETELLCRADRGKGRFRTFLLLALNNYVADRFRYERREKRGAGLVVALDSKHGGDAAAHDGTADAFELAWARQVLGQAVRRMRRECDGSGRRDVWDVFRVRVLDPALLGTDPLPYRQLVARFAIATPAEASNLLITAKRMFARTLRQAVTRYETDPDRVEEEIADLQAILSRRE